MNNFATGFLLGFPLGWAVGVWFMLAIRAMASVR